MAGRLYKIDLIDITPENCSYPPSVIVAAQNRKQTESGGLDKCLESKVCTRVMVTENIDIQDRLTNGQVGEIFNFKVIDDDVQKICLKFGDNNIGKAHMLDFFFRQNEYVITERYDAYLQQHFIGST